jgi:hypothetical protein
MGYNTFYLTIHTLLFLFRYETVHQDRISSLSSTLYVERISRHKSHLRQSYNDGVVCFTKEHREHPLPSSKSCSTLSFCVSLFHVYVESNQRSFWVSNEAKGFISTEHNMIPCHEEMYTMTTHVMLKERTRCSEATGSSTITLDENSVFSIPFVKKKAEVNGRRKVFF